MNNFYTTVETTGELELKRGRQRKKWMWQRIVDELVYRLRNDEKVRDKVEALEDAVVDGLVNPGSAADEILDGFMKSWHSNRT